MPYLHVRLPLLAVNLLYPTSNFLLVFQPWFTELLCKHGFLNFYKYIIYEYNKDYNPTCVTVAVRVCPLSINGSGFNKGNRGGGHGGGIEGSCIIKVLAPTVDSTGGKISHNKQGASSNNSYMFCSV